MTNSRSATQIRAIFSTNLRQLTSRYPSVSEVSRQLNINRAQYNRYLNGESYPRPDILHRICSFFQTDARILTQPLEILSPSCPDLMTHPEIRDYLALENAALGEDLFPSGFYRFSRHSFLYPERFIRGLLFVYRADGWTFIKGSESRQSVLEQGLPEDHATRRFKGYVIAVEDGICAMISRRNAMTTTFNFLSPVASLNRNFWQGYAARTVNETINGTRVSRMVYEYIGTATGDVLSTARTAGFCDADALLPYHRHLLQVGTPFA